MAHDHASAAASHRGRLLAVLLIGVAILAIEVVGAILANSLALLADAGHVLTDVVGVGMALLAIWFARRPATNGRTFGYLRLEILAAVTNAFLLFGIAAFVLFEAWQRLSEPHEIASGLMLAFAVAGAVANGISLLLLRDAQKESLNMRGAYLEVMGDLAGSAAVIVAAIVIAVTGWTQADIVASVVIALLILPRTLSLLREATDVLLEATPKGVDMDHVRQHIRDAPGVVDCHD
ncbi:MAG: cation diffusion facilitator family transporter, partial [Candidatus Limnocylindrales bacterium]